MNKPRPLFDIDVTKVGAVGDDPAGYIGTNEALGLIVEADTLDQLALKIQAVAPDLFELNITSQAQGMSASAKPQFRMRFILDEQGHGRILPGFEGAFGA